MHFTVTFLDKKLIEKFNFEWENTLDLENLSKK